jgi:hypothetical protein
MLGGPTLCDGKDGEISIPYPVTSNCRAYGKPTKSQAVETPIALDRAMSADERQPSGRKVKARSAAPITPNPTLSHTSAVSVMAGGRQHDRDLGQTLPIHNVRTAIGNSGFEASWRDLDPSMLSSGFFGSFSYRATVALEIGGCFSNVSCALGSVTALFCAERRGRFHDRQQIRSSRSEESEDSMFFPSRVLSVFAPASARASRSAEWR